MTSSKLREDDRGLAYKLAIFGGIFLVAALVMAVMGPAFDAVESKAGNYTDSKEANTGLGYVKDARSLIPLFAGLLGMIMILAAAAAESRRR